MKTFRVDWRFCPECQKIQERAGYLAGMPEVLESEWKKCEHDYRPNSAKAVLENQAKEFKEMGMAPYKVRTYQSPQEFENFISCVQAQLVPRTILEIGSFHGGTANRMAERLFNPFIVCVDRCFDFWLADDLDCIKIVGESTTPETLEQVKDALYGRGVDLLFIDGDHSFTGEMADYEAYSPLVRDGGIIALHDTHSIYDVGQVFEQIPGKVKIDIFSYQGIGLVVK